MEMNLKNVAAYHIPRKEEDWGTEIGNKDIDMGDIDYVTGDADDGEDDEGGRGVANGNGSGNRNHIDSR